MGNVNDVGKNHHNWLATKRNCLKLLYQRIKTLEKKKDTNKTLSTLVDSLSNTTDLCRRSRKKQASFAQIILLVISRVGQNLRNVANNLEKLTMIKFNVLT
ncbi:hypothetical protein BpHYR1_033404 [Brachionus plicatilis]|uniref:Uncharacterized protein n=1 Tax=Brachionus plicatilis TaxID=10195 RepID=A0A3M7SFC0_BRAPC|nr:hypothetical protein BpHYR1_033404 [Brachionus plicatilis]